MRIFLLHNNSLRIIFCLLAHVSVPPAAMTGKWHKIPPPPMGQERNVHALPSMSHPEQVVQPLRDKMRGPWLHVRHDEYYPLLGNWQYLLLTECPDSSSFF